MAKRGIGLVLDLPSPEELRKKRFRKGGGEPMAGGDAADEGPGEEGSDEEEASEDPKIEAMEEFMDAVKDGDAEAACAFLDEYIKKYT